MTQNFDNQGYLYCFSNTSYPYFKIGYTLKDPIIRCKELYTSGVPTPFQIEFAKLVKNVEKKEKAIHSILDEYRINSNREFFDINIIKIKNIFDSIDGEWWNQINGDHTISDNNSDNDRDIDNNIEINKLGCRDTKKCFKHLQKIRHIEKVSNNIWEGYYDFNKDKIIFENNEYTMYLFVRNHYIQIRPDRTPEANAWKECECLINDNWISTFNLPEL